MGEVFTLPPFSPDNLGLGPGPHKGCRESRNRGFRHYRRSGRRSQGSLGYRWNQSPQSGEDLTRQKVAEILDEGNSLNERLKTRVQSVVRSHRQLKGPDLGWGETSRPHG